jgi:hypothetical protein
MLSTLKYLIAIMFVCSVAALFVGCAKQQPAHLKGTEILPLGLYQVLERECSYPAGAPEDCSQTQYIELVEGVFHGIAEDQLAFVTWLAVNPTLEHDYVARDLAHGRFTSAGEFLLADDEYGKEWFVIEDGRVIDYYFVRKARQTAHGSMAGKSHFTLRHTPRNTEIDRLLPYPEATSSPTP